MDAVVSLPPASDMAPSLGWTALAEVALLLMGCTLLTGVLLLLGLPLWGADPVMDPGTDDPPPPRGWLWVPRLLREMTLLAPPPDAAPPITKELPDATEPLVARLLGPCSQRRPWSLPGESVRRRSPPPPALVMPPEDGGWTTIFRVLTMLG